MAIFYKSESLLGTGVFSMHLWYPVWYLVYDGTSSNKNTGREYGLIIKALEIYYLLRYLLNGLFLAARVTDRESAIILESILLLLVFS